MKMVQRKALQSTNYDFLQWRIRKQKNLALSKDVRLERVQPKVTLRKAGVRWKQREELKRE